MKGSPLHRNFGLGASPIKTFEDTTHEHENPEDPDNPIIHGGTKEGAPAKMKSPIKQNFLAETKEEDFLNEDGTLNVEAHKKAIDDSMIRHGLKPKPPGWVDPNVELKEAGFSTTASAQPIIATEMRPSAAEGWHYTWGKPAKKVRTEEQILQELKDALGEAYFDMDQTEIDYIIEHQMKMDAEGTEGEKTVKPNVEQEIGEQITTKVDKK